MTGLLRLFKSSKAWVVALALLVLALLAYSGMIPASEVRESIELLVLGFLGATAAEDVAAKLPRRDKS